MPWKVVIFLFLLKLFCFCFLNVGPYFSGPFGITVFIFSRVLKQILVFLVVLFVLLCALFL